MTEQQHGVPQPLPDGAAQENPQDATGVGDEVSVGRVNPQVFRNEEGETVLAEHVSGPDPRFWGSDEDRQDPLAALDATGEGAGDPGAPPDTITADGVAGPDSRFWTLGEDGQYDRDELAVLNGPSLILDERGEDAMPEHVEGGYDEEDTDAGDA